MDKVIVYTDGACSANGKANSKGGYGVVLIYNNKVTNEFYGGFYEATNQKAEMIAAITGIKQAKKVFPDASHYEVRSDSAYLVNCMRERWYRKWKSNGWQTINKTPVVNRALWEELIGLVSDHSVVFKKVKGHHIDEHNNRADELAKLGLSELYLS